MVSLSTLFIRLRAWLSESICQNLGYWKNFAILYYKFMYTLSHCQIILSPKSICLGTEIIALTAGASAGTLKKKNFIFLNANLQ